MCLAGDLAVAARTVQHALGELPASAAFDPVGAAHNTGRSARLTRDPLPEAPPRPRAAADGSELDLCARVTDLDPLAQLITYEMRARRWRHGLACSRSLA